MWRLWYILAMLMVDDDTLADEEQTPWDENCLSVTLYCWVKHLMGVTVCSSAHLTALVVILTFFRRRAFPNPHVAVQMLRGPMEYQPVLFVQHGHTLTNAVIVGSPQTATEPFPSRLLLLWFA